MSDQPSLAQGGMSPEGKTNPVGILEPKLDPQDKKCCARRSAIAAARPTSAGWQEPQAGLRGPALGELDEFSGGAARTSPKSVTT
ncbi:hypothetical protein MNU23_02820 [Pseudomonas aeruginosa]|uniref:hypothetical protein n=1 Tax=Pseudomonas aeruginosa TaxID=287 RepID=UPI0021A4C760|nr:hypothetical protein [Pseudomonas aeruginosa]